MKLHKTSKCGQPEYSENLSKVGLSMIFLPSVRQEGPIRQVCSSVSPVQENLNAIYKTEIRRLNQKLEQTQKIIPVSWLAAGGDNKQQK